MKTRADDWRLLTGLALLCVLGFIAGKCDAGDCQPPFRISYEIRSDGVLAKGVMEQDGSLQVLDNALEIRNGRIIANGKDYGRFSNRDFILLDRDGQLFVNGKKRKAAEPGPAPDGRGT